MLNTLEHYRLLCFHSYYHVGYNLQTETKKHLRYIFSIPPFLSFKLFSTVMAGRNERAKQIN